MRHRLVTIKDETVDLESKKDDEEGKDLNPTGKNEYTARVKTRLNAWANELDRWETEAYQVDLDEECAAQLAKLDQKLAEGYEKMRDLMGMPDEDWKSIRKDAETLWEDILSTLDEIRRCVGGE